MRSPMRFPKLLLAVGLVCPVLQGCRENPAGITLSDIVGVYTGTKFEFRSVADPSMTFDLVSDSNVTIDWNVDAEGNFIMGFHIPGNDEAFQGMIVIDGDDITLDGMGPVTGNDTISGTLTLTGSTLTMIFRVGAEFDFDGDATDEPANLQMVFHRTQAG
jgi:hypothetical protein